MSFEGPVIAIAGLIEIELPLKTVRLCDGAWVDWPGRGRFVSSDPAFGTLGHVEAPEEKVSDEAASARMSLLPPSVTAASALLLPGAQGRAIRGWDAEIERTTNRVIGIPDQQFEGLIDTLTVVNERGERSVLIEFSDAAQRLWLIKEGNVLAPAWHKRIWSGETGLDHATGSPVAVPWGIIGPARGAGLSGGGSGSFGGGGFSSIARFSLDNGIG